MNIAEIIAVDAKRFGKMPGAVLHGVSIAADKRKAKLFKDNKTVVILDPINSSKNEFKVHMFTADSPAGVKDSAKRLFEQVKAAPGVQKIYANLENQKLVELARMAGAEVIKSDKKGFNWMTEL